MSNDAADRIAIGIALLASLVIDWMNVAAGLVALFVAAGLLFGRAAKAGP